ARPDDDVGEHADAQRAQRTLVMEGVRAALRIGLEAAVEVEALSHGPGVRAVEAGASHGAVDADERVHLADLPVARERAAGARVDHGLEAPGAIPAGLAHVFHPGAGDEVG